MTRKEGRDARHDRRGAAWAPAVREARDGALAGMSEPGERQAMLMALRTLEQQGKMVRSGDRRHADVTGRRVRLAVS